MIRLALLLALLATPAQAEPSVTVAFSPHGGSTELVVQTIRSAERTVHVAAYSFTSRPIAAALIDAASRGVAVAAVLDKSNLTDRYSEAGELDRAGIAVRIDDHYAIMHDKFIVVDGVTVETGSFNLSASAETRNAENLLVLRELPEVARRYEGEWQRLWAESR